MEQAANIKHKLTKDQYRERVMLAQDAFQSALDSIGGGDDLPNKMKALKVTC